MRAQREEWAGAGRGRVRQGDNAGGMGTFSLTPERGGGRRLSQRPGRRKELAKQARKDRKKESTEEIKKIKKDRQMKDRNGGRDKKEG